MENVVLEVKGTQIIITIDVAREGAPSKSGKTNVIASTHGSVPIPGFPALRLGLNVFRYREDR